MFSNKGRLDLQSISISSSNHNKGGLPHNFHTLSLPITSSHIDDHSSIAERQRISSVRSRSGGREDRRPTFRLISTSAEINKFLDANGKSPQFARDRCQHHISSHFGKKVSVMVCQVSMGSLSVYPTVWLADDEPLAVQSLLHPWTTLPLGGPSPQPVEQLFSAKGSHLDP